MQRRDRVVQACLHRHVEPIDRPRAELIDDVSWQLPGNGSRALVVRKLARASPASATPPLADAAWIPVTNSAAASSAGDRYEDRMADIM